MEQDESNSSPLKLSVAESAILFGLHAFGRSKTFAAILDEAKIPHGDTLRFQIATTLEHHGLIHNISYQLPVKIRAELTPSGVAWVEATRTQYQRWFNVQPQGGWVQP